MHLVLKANGVHELRDEIVNYLRVRAKGAAPQKLDNTPIAQAQAHARVAAFNSIADELSDATLEITDDLPIPQAAGEDAEGTEPTNEMPDDPPPAG